MYNRQTENVIQNMSDTVMSDFYLIKRPAIDASVAYQYKTDVLASYGNKEDRIAQRDIPRIAFSYSFLASDLKEALEINSSLMKTGNTGTIWVPDWTAGQELLNVISGENTYTAGLTNFVNEQYGVLYVNDRTWTIVTVNIINNSLIFDSTVEYDKALLMPLFACDVIGEPEISQANSLCYTFNVSLECKRPLFSSVYEWGTKFLGHDVWKDFHVDIDSSTLSRKSAQEVQENDYEIGVRDRFTFFERTYNSFGVKVLCKENELPSFRNFIKRRWGMTYSFFMPSGMADFQKAGASEDTIGSYLRIRNNKHDFTARPYIVIQNDETLYYANVIAIYDDENNEVEDIETAGEYITLKFEDPVNLKYKDADSIQILYFVRLADDTVTFNTSGVSADNDNVYSIELTFVETDFYDATLIDYDDTWGSVKDLNTIYLFKVSATDAILENGADHGYAIRNTAANYRNYIVPGKYEGTYAIKDTPGNYSNAWVLTTNGVSSAQIGIYEDFVFQIEGKFDEYSGNAKRELIGYGVPSCCINLYRQNGYYWIFIGSERKDSGNNNYVYISMKMNRWLGDEFGWHEWAVQRHNGVLYFLCDGLLCGVSRDFYGQGYSGATNSATAINSPEYPIAANGTVQQFRLAKGLNVYTGEMSVTNREYKLNDYALTKLREFDNATVCIVDFKNFNDRMGQFFNAAPVYYDVYNNTQFITGVSERVRQAIRICENQNTGTGYMPEHTVNSTGLLINNSTKWCLHSNIHFEQRYYHDFWFEFTMQLNSAPSWTEQSIFPLRGIMVNIIVSSGQYTVEACGLGSGVFVNIGEPLTFALGVDSQENKIVTYINGTRSAMIALDTYMSTNPVGYMSIYPMAIRKGGAVPTRSYYLHRLRIIELCLTTEETYDVENEWTLGDYHTVPFTIEYGTYGLDNTKLLKLKNVESVHPIAPYFTSLKQSQAIDICNKLWSDGSKRTEVVSPAENTLYKVVLTNSINGSKGYGWYYVNANYTGVLFESLISSSQEYNTGSQQVVTIPHVRAKRYDYVNHNWETYTPTIGNIENVAVIPPFNNPDYARVGNSLYFRGGGGNPSYQFMIDFLGDEGEIEIPSSSTAASIDTTRWLNEHRIKQVEFVLNPPFNFAFNEYDHSYYGVYASYYTRHMQMWSIATYSFSSHDLYSDVLIPANQRYENYTSHFAVGVKSGCDYWDQWRQKLNTYTYSLGVASATANPSQIDPNWLHLTQPQSSFSNNLAPVHVVVQFVMTNYTSNSSYYSGEDGCIQQVEKVWINGKEYNTVEQWWEQYKSKFNYNRKNVTLNALTNNTSGITGVFKGFVMAYCNEFMEQAGTGFGAIWGCIYYGDNRQTGGWSRYVSCIKAYENEHYNGDFDAETVMERLQNERLPAVNFTE